MDCHRAPLVRGEAARAGLAERGAAGTASEPGDALGKGSAGAGRLVPRVLAVALALPLAVYAAIGSFARYTADDYCWAGILRTEGFFRAQVLWYTGYSPRYAFTFLVNLVELAGPAIVPALPAVAIVVWVATLTWTFSQFGLRTWQGLLLAELAALATFVSAPDIAQSLYWQTGMLTYLLPLVLATFVTGWIRRAHSRRRLTIGGLLVSLAVTFVAGGLSETYLIPQNVALTLALGTAVLFGRRDTGSTVLSAHLAAALAGGVLALLAIVFAPATTYRVGGSPADLWLASSAAIATAAYQGLRLARYFPFVILLCLTAPGLLSVHARQVDRKWVLLVTASVAVTLPFCYFPSFYAQNGNPPARSLIVPGAILVAYLLYLGYTFGGVLDILSARLRTVAAVAALAVPLGIALFTVPEVAVAAQHAVLWDVEDAHIRAARDAGQTDLRVPPLPRYLGENFVTTDPQDWFNVCVARYYGVRTIAATPG